MFHKLLIANRGEIACRIIKTAKKLGITTVAIYSSADQNSLHVNLADEAYYVGEAKASESYLNIENIINIAKLTNTCAIHPGYGFLSESPSFAKRCLDENIIFVGPSIEALEAMGSKQFAKQLLEKTNVPLTPGYHGNNQTAEFLLQEAEKIGFPILLKAADGGGGKGMRIVTKADDFFANLASAKREAMASFASDTMIIEKLISAPRHIEVQIIADNHGTILHLFERDCSIQRRHQKIIEEAPATIEPEFRKNITNAAVEVARAINYRGAGTIEFLSDGCNFYFMEMNTRLQVEHPVTEMITGLDLVELQLRIAANELLQIKQADIQINGHAIECRIYAEDPENNFMPSIGKIEYLQQILPPFTRIDSGITTNSEVSRFYDPMLAKVIAWGENREQARIRLLAALHNLHMVGVKNNLQFLTTVLQNHKFITNQISTNFLNEETLTISKPDLSLSACLAASIDYLIQVNNKIQDPILADTHAFQMHLQANWHKKYIINNQLVHIKITPTDTNKLNLAVYIEQDASETELATNYAKETSATVYLDTEKQQLIFAEKNSTTRQHFYIDSNKIIIFTKNGNIEIFAYKDQVEHLENNHSKNDLTAPMPGTIVAVLKNPKDQVKLGEALVIMEAMKMEHTILAPRDGTINSIFYNVGTQVQEGATLITMEKS